ncbi:hypothetical protein ONZ43_g4538 [Nemania bipapillata]|uniref:Uncharacterized protein n=1 Tax=Nemania bipapillata TaxID=110536 RepID=A0ACC2ILE3_9PEZI|nr:hypothetical protein ONZ43_g4538 [Nemania bipapillata]
MSGTGNVEDMWVWAVDVDFDTDFPPVDEAADPRKVEYRGYMRVRLQQLVDGFFEMRHFHAEDQPFFCLWTAAIKSRNRVFERIRA